MRSALAVGTGCALCVLAGTACGTSAPTATTSRVQSSTITAVPQPGQQRILAEFGRTYLPPKIPQGYIYIRWQVETGSADVFGDRLVVWFGKHGRVILWRVEDSADPNAESHQDCGRHPFGKRVRIGGRTILYIGGAVGQSATLCLPNHYAVVAWNRYSLSQASLERLVASAHKIG